MVANRYLPSISLRTVKRSRWHAARAFRFVVIVLLIGLFELWTFPSVAQKTFDFDFEKIDLAAFHSLRTAPELVPGVQGKALRTDGFSTWLELPLRLDGNRVLSGAMWVALESYPSDRELPVRDSLPSSFLNQANESRGFDLFVDTYGRWGLRVSTSRGVVRVLAPGVFPLYRWTRIGFTVDPVRHLASVFQDGKPVASAELAAGAVWSPADTQLIVGKGWRDARVSDFLINALDGAFEKLVITQDAAMAANITNEGGRPAGSVNESLSVPMSRFADDHLRPRFHALPSANWTNEPHGLVLAGGRYHLFHQRTPNGPFMRQMHWGHMSSSDLVNWTYQRDALFPSLQTESAGFDMKGAWSGDVIIEGKTAFAFYTSVHHTRVFNPAISVAISSDPKLQHWEKRGPIISVPDASDFRDPFLWKEDGTWNMIIGAAYNGHGGLAYYRCESRNAPTCWERVPQFSTIPCGAMDIGSMIWEMPVFEALGERRVLIANPIGRLVSKYGDPATRAVYWMGKWADGRFVPDAETPQMLDVIPGHVSPTVVRTASGALVGIGIVDERRDSQAQKSAGWANAFSLPREWFVTSNGRSLGQRPWPALEMLRDGPERISARAMTISGTRIIDDVGLQAEVKLRFRSGAVGAYGVTLAQSPDGKEFTTILYDPSTQQIVVDKRHSSLSDRGEGPQVIRGNLNINAFGEPLDWHLFMDGSVVDVFLGNGAAFSFRIYPTRRNASQFGVVSRGSVTLETAALWRLRPAGFNYDLED